MTVETSYTVLKDSGCESLEINQIFMVLSFSHFYVMFNNNKMLFYLK